MSCPGLHCPGCGHGAAASIRTVALAAVVVAAAAATWEILTALLWVILTVGAAAAIAVSTAIVISRRTTAAPIHLSQPRPVATLTASPVHAELEARLRAAEINAQAAILAAHIIAQQTRPQPLSSYHANDREAIPR
jgi:hypothetical protein